MSRGEVSWAVGVLRHSGVLFLEMNITAAFRGREAGTGLDDARPAAGQLGGAEGRGTQAGLAEEQPGPG